MEKDLSYEQAMKRLETIVSKVEQGEMDIDSLASKLKEAKELVEFCKAKLLKVEDDVKKILEN